MTITCNKMFVLPDAGTLKAFADIVLDDQICIKGLRITEGKKGLFVSMPREQGKDAKWYDQVVCLEARVYDQIAEVVLEYYYEKSRTTEQEVDTWASLV